MNTSATTYYERRFLTMASAVRHYSGVLDPRSDDMIVFEHGTYGQEGERLVDPDQMRTVTAHSLDGDEPVVVDVAILGGDGLTRGDLCQIAEAIESLVVTKGSHRRRTREISLTL